MGWLVILDVLQVRNDSVYILGCKLDAAKNIMAAGAIVSLRWQYHFVLVFLYRIRCAWFDKIDYIAFSPSKVKV